MAELPRQQARMPEAFEILSMQHMPATPRHKAFLRRVRGLFTNKPLTFQPQVAKGAWRPDKAR
jgi:hypothetical protein